MKIILASASDRRKELLCRIVSDFDIVISDFDEASVSYNGAPDKYVMEIAKGKAMDVKGSVTSGSLIIGCDTVVVFNNTIMGKPKSESEAFEMLKLLSGNTHRVYSGVALLKTDSGEVCCDYACTEVKFSKLTEEQIKKYVQSGDPMDKAGAYGIQGLAGVFVEEIRGCYYNVVGFPLNKIYSMISGMGVNL